MLIQIITVIIVAIAIEQFTNITSSVDLLEGCRAWFRKKFPKIQKLSWCSYCQSFWLSGILSLFLPLDIILKITPYFYLGLFLKWIILWMFMFGVRNYFNQIFSLIESGEKLMTNIINDQDLDSSQK